MLWIALLVVVIVLAAVAAGVLPMLKRMGIL